MAKKLVILDNHDHYPNEEYLMDEADAARLEQIVDENRPHYLSGIIYQNEDIAREVNEIKGRAEKVDILYVTNYE